MLSGVLIDIANFWAEAPWIPASTPQTRTRKTVERKKWSMEGPRIKSKERRRRLRPCWCPKFPLVDEKRGAWRFTPFTKRTLLRPKGTILGPQDLRTLSTQGGPWDPSWDRWEHGKMVSSKMAVGVILWNLLGVSSIFILPCLSSGD